MSVHDDDLLPELRRSTDPVDRRLARLLGRLGAGDPAVPRASEGLAAFLASASAGAPLDPSTDNDTAPVASAVDNPVVQLGRPVPRSSPMRPRLVPLKKVLKTGLLAKVMLGTTVALTGVGAAAATGNLPGTGDDNVVVVTPADDSGGSTTPSDDPLGVIDFDDQDDDADDDGPDGDDDQGEDDDDQGDDDDDQGDDADDSGAGVGAADDADDDQGEDNDDQGDDDQGDDDQGDDEDEPDDDADEDNSGPGGDDDADDDESDDDDSSGPGGDDSSGEDDESGDD